MPDAIYLDNNATTRPLPAVVAAVSEAMQSRFANPGSPHAAGRKARQALEDARESLASILGAHPAEVIFTSGGTESSNLAIRGFTAGAPPGRLALTRGEHPATRETCLALEQERDFQPHWLQVNEAGLLTANQFENLPWNEVRLVTVILAHNETGVIQDLTPVTERCRKHSVPFHVDAVQAVGKIPVSFAELGGSSLALAAHKFHGPRGIGALLVRRDCKPQPMLFGGFQESGRRPGTECVALAVGMAKALECWQAEQSDRTVAMQTARDRLQQLLAERCAPVMVHAANSPRLPNTLSIGFPGCAGEPLLVNLDLAGVACSLGSACASGSTEPAPALLAMGVPTEIAQSSLRLSLSHETTLEEVDTAAARIAAVVQRLRGL